MPVVVVVAVVLCETEIKICRLENFSNLYHTCIYVCMYGEEPRQM